jgi:hypothetical protein
VHDVRRAASLVGRFGLLVLASLLVNGLDLPWQAAAIGFSVAAVVVGIQAVRAVARARMRTSAMVFTSVGVGLAALMVLGQGLALAFWPLQADYQKCRRDALTISSERQCQVDYERRILDLSRLGRTG